MNANNDFKKRVEMIVSQIPRGRVMTYGQIATICGNPSAARIVGGIAHFGNSRLPWHRVVNRNGGLATGYPGGKMGHKKALESENVTVEYDLSVKVNELIWKPPA